MKTIYYTASSLDGFIATNEDSLDWLFQLGNPVDSSYPAFIAEVGALAMGASTYRWLLSHAEQVKAETGSPGRIRNRRGYSPHANYPRSKVLNCDLSEGKLPSSIPQ